MPKNKSSYTVRNVSILLPNIEEEQKSIDIKANVVEIELFENINKPYIDGRIAVLDDFGMMNLLAIQGTERVRLVIGGSDQDQSPIIVKTFFISKINDTKRINEKSQILSFDLVEEHVYVNAVKQISRAYTENIENVITDLCKTELNIDVLPTHFKGTAQGVRKIIVPYLSPLEAIQWIKTRATTDIGSPIFLYSDLYSSYVYLSDLDSLLSEQFVINEKLPLRYSTAVSSVSDKDESLRPYYEVLSFRENNSENTLMLYEQGAIGSYYANLDAGTGTSSGSHVSVRDIIDEFYSNGLLSVQSAQKIYDPDLTIQGQLSDQYNSLNVFQVTSSKTYNQYQSIHDETVVLDTNNDISESRLKVNNKIIRYVLKRNIIEVGISGALLFEGKVPVGSKLRLLFLNSDVNKNTKEVKDLVDRRKSGDYLLLATHHKLSEQRHTAVLRLTKFGELPSDFAL